MTDPAEGTRVRARGEDRPGTVIRVRDIPLDAVAKRQLNTSAESQRMALVRLDGETREWTAWWSLDDLRMEDH